MAAPAIVVQVVTHGSAATLDACLAAVRAQTLAPRRVLVVDSGSPGGAPDTLAASHGADLLALDENVGYGRAHDRALLADDAPLVLLLNPDCRLAPDHLERLAARLLADEGLAGVQGKLWKADGAPPLLDSTGLVLTRTRRNFDRDEGQPDRGQRDLPDEPFGVSGAASLWRRAALDDLRVEGAVFDPDFWMYREDLDLCWRARLRGWRLGYTPAAVAWHPRGFGRADRARVPRPLRHASLRNRYLLLLKNESAGALLRDAARLLPYEVAQLAWVALREPGLLAAYLDALGRAPAALRRRRDVQGRRRLPGDGLRDFLL